MRRLATTAALVLAFLIPMSGAAFADDMLTTVRGSAGSVISDMTVGGLYPTAYNEHTVYVEVAAAVSTGTAAAVLEAVEDVENGCNRPETSSGDTTCDAAGGELSSQLLVTITPGRPAGVLAPSCVADDSVPPVSATLASLEDQIIPLGETSAALGRSVCFVLRQELPDRADNNLVQTDEVSYDLRVLGALATDPGNTVVLPGEVVDRAPADGGDGDGEAKGELGRVLRSGTDGVAGAADPRLHSLASTGAAILLLLVTGLATLAAGLQLRRRANQQLSVWDRPVGHADSK